MTSRSVSTAASTSACLDRRVLGGGVEQHAELTVKRFLARQRRHRVEHRAELVEELFRHDPCRLAAALGFRTGDRRRLAPVLGLHLPVEVLQRIGDDLVDDRLDRLAVLGVSSMKTRGMALASAVELRMTASMPAGFSPFQFGPTIR